MFPSGVSLTPYRSNHDLVTLRRWFYQKNVNNLRLGLEKVKVYLSRGKVPHAVSATASLVALEMMEGLDSESLRHAYCSVLTRIVNGLLDPFQQASVALPLLKLAKEIDLPSYFVEIRHMATHEELPSLDHLKLVAQEAKLWLERNYWVNIIDSPAVVPERDHYQGAAPLSAAADLRTYKKIRKLNLDFVPLDSKNDETSKNYVAAVNRLKGALHRSAHRLKILHELIFNCLIYTDKRDRDVLKRTKHKTLVKIYAPLFQELGRDFQVSLLLALVRYSSRRFSISFTISEEEQAIPWAEYLLEQLTSGPFPISSQIQDVSTLRSTIDTHLGLLENDSAMRKALSGALNTVEEEKTPKKFRMPPSLDDLIGSPKRQKVSVLPTPQPEIPPTKPATADTFFPSVPNWTPRPFGYRAKK